jgi:sugar O-acyltransferase (sialic acid O-acetyltransferase NeuD family)
MIAAGNPSAQRPLPVVILGCGGHAKVVADIARRAGRTIRAFVDPAATAALYLDVRLVRGIEELLGGAPFEAVAAVGDNARRLTIVSEMESVAGAIGFAILQHPTASVAGGVALGAGTVVMAQAAINPSSALGRHAIVNTHASIDHDCRIGDFVSIGPGAVLGGEVSVGHGAAISIGAVVAHGIAIGANSVIGAGAVVVADIPADVVAYGNPCRIIRPRRLGEPYL